MQTLNHHFKIALAASGLTKQAAADQFGVTPSHLYRVLNGQRESDDLRGKIEEFIEKHAKRSVA